MNQYHCSVSVVIVALAGLPSLLAACGAGATSSQAPSATPVVSTTPVHR
jgi:hypothetical protein